jgi:hypothetical protein
MPPPMKIALFIVLTAIVLGLYALRPVCVPVSAETAGGFDPPIATRTDRDLYVRVFQRREGQWHQCKTWISRTLFF